MPGSDLFEREKELDCLYNLADFFLTYHGLESEMLRRVETELRAAMAYPDSLEVALELKETSEEGQVETLSRQTMDRHFYAGVPVGEKEFLSAKLHAQKLAAMPSLREQGLIGSVLRMCSGAILRSRNEAEVKAKNATLTELLQRLQETREREQKEIRLRLKGQIFPLLNEIGQGAQGILRKQVNLLRGELDKVTDSSPAPPQCLPGALTPREVEICNLVGQGLSSKDIADMLHISRETVERHRCNVRRKLGLNKTGENLATFLMNL
ncbi:MAG TPA: LuxR family transcriptional regulator [Sediminispirochaeta sp.]|nr:LuxR family transcriptional regulator [Sediminispirochaeta sp.]